VIIESSATQKRNPERFKVAWADLESSGLRQLLDRQALLGFRFDRPQAVDVEGPRGRCGGSSNTWRFPEALQKVFAETDLIGYCAIGCISQGNFCDKHTSRLEAERVCTDFEESRQEKTCSDKEHNGERNFRNNEEIAPVEVRARRGQARVRCPQNALLVHLESPPRR
jgi:hypothetical protein